MSTPVEFRWLGTAGVELRMKDQILLIDPYLTRIPLWKLWGWRIHPDRALVAEVLPRCDFVLVSHGHWDHILDVPEIVRNTGAPVWGTRNTAQLLSVCNVPEDKIHEIRIGDSFALRDFQVEVRWADHVPMPGFLPGPVAPNLKPPLRAQDYRMDEYLSFRVAVEGLCLLTDPGSTPEAAAPADIVFVIPFQEFGYYETLLRVARPRVVIPYHCDDYFRPLSKPVRPMLGPPKWAFPPLRRIDLVHFRRTLEQLAPETTVFIPEMFRAYDAGALVGKSL